MFKILRNKKATILILVLLVIGSGTAGWINKHKLSDLPVMGTSIFKDSNVEDNPNEPNRPDTEKYLSSARLDREKARSRMISQLKEIICNQDVSDNDKEDASEQINRITSRIEAEAIIENLLKAKGLGQSVLFLSENDANLVIEIEKISKTQIAQIKNLIVENAKIKSSSIRIVPIG